MASPQDSHGGGYIPGNISQSSPNVTPASDGRHGGGYIPGNMSPSSSNATPASDGRHGGGYIPGNISPSSSNATPASDGRHGGGYIPKRPVQSVQRNLCDPPRSIETPPNPRNGDYPAVQEPYMQQQSQTSSQTGFGVSSLSTSYYPVNHCQSSVQSPYNGGHANNQSMPPPGQPVPNQQPGYNQADAPIHDPEVIIRPTPQPKPGRKRGFGVFRRKVAETEKTPFINTVEADEYNDAYDPKREIRLRGYRHIFDAQTRVRFFKHPHFYKPSQWIYDGTTTYRNKDSMWRFREGAFDDRYISPFNGRTEKLIVQAVDSIYDDSSSHGTWNRTFIRDISPWHLRLANWPVSHIDYRADNVTAKQTLLMLLKYIPTSLALILVISFPGNVEGEVRNGGRYDCFPYKFHGYSKVARNLLEEKVAKKHARHAPQKTNPVANRLLRPRYLCVLNDPESSDMAGWQRVFINDWTKEHRSNRPLPYLFISYTTEQFPSNSNSHCDTLHQVAERAARAEGLPAYWISCSCMPDPDQLQDDVFRISDVIRGASAVAIVVGPPVHQEPYAAVTTRDAMLLQWGQRLWTFPEVLLSPIGKPLKVYKADSLETEDGPPGPPLILEKNQFPALVWSDRHVSRQLVDHYDGNLTLSRLELVILALECLYSRQHGRYMAGDHSYALMGLLRVRPEVDETDSDFQAFARLSLANDSDLLLERLACILPKDPSQPWYSLDDAYEVNLWDIYPTCQLAGIGEDNTIIVDGARGANVRWKSFASVHVRRRWSWTRLVVRLLLHTASIALMIGVIMTWISYWIIKKENHAASVFPGNMKKEALVFVKAVVRIVVDPNVIQGWGIVFVLYSIPMLLFAPKLIRVLYGGKLWNTQPWLFGFEGYLPIEQIEILIFGDRKGRLRWHPFGSPLSRHEVDNEYDNGHCNPVDPTTDVEIRTLVEKAKKSTMGDQKIFTLVDTNTMTVTLFQAARPPVCFLLLGSEGGMQRAVGCSYDWTTGTLYRETVLRMETSCKDKMDLVSRARIGLEKKVEGPGIIAAPPKPKGIKRRSKM